jgi:hypothetical protein
MKKKAELKVGSKTYQIAPPTMRTLIDVSTLIAKMPKKKMDLDNAFSDSLAIARECEVLGNILALLILGSRKEHFLLGRLFNERKRNKLATHLLNNLSPAELNTAIASVLQEMEIASFFAVTASLIDINLLKATKEVV